MPKRFKKLQYVDYWILIPYLILCVLGIVMVYSASSYIQIKAGEPAAKIAINQAVFFFLSLIAIGFIYHMKLSFLNNEKLIKILFIAVTIMLLLTRFTPLGVEANGAKSWFNIGFTQIQPLELFKILLIWFLAKVLASNNGNINGNFWQVMKQPLVWIAVPVVLIWIQPDNGGVLILGLIMFSMLICSGISPVYSIAGYISLFSAIFIGSRLALLLHGIIPEYVYNRFEAFLDPFADVQVSGYQIVNSYYALNNGGWFGVGLGNSIQKKGFLPEAHTDFIFSILVEELGMLVGLITLALLFIMILRIIYIGIRSKNTFNMLMCIGIGSMIFIQIFVNIGGLVGIIPLTGVTLPFLSQGGSSLFILSISIGFALNISAHEKRSRDGVNPVDSEPRPKLELVK